MPPAIFKYFLFHYNYMPGKGQVSIEFIFTIIALFSVALVLSSASLQFIEYQNEIHLRNQEKKIAETVAEIVGVSGILDEQDRGGKVQYRIPELKVLGKSGGIPCTVSIRVDSIRVTAKYGEMEFQESVPFSKPPMAPIVSKNSGELLELDYT